MSEIKPSKARIVATCAAGTCTRMEIISDNGHRASTRVVHVVLLVSAADSRTERLRLLLTASNSRHYIPRMCLIQLSLMSADFPNK